MTNEQWIQNLEYQLEQLKRRLAYIKAQYPNADWRFTVMKDCIDIQLTIAKVNTELLVRRGKVIKSGSENW
jgi:hypothetical protein